MRANMSAASSQSTTESGKNTVVIGGGPGGLIDSLYMLLKKQNVTLFEGRDEFATRDNQVLLQEQLVKYMLNDFTQFYECGYEIEYVFRLERLDIEIRHDPNKAAKYAKAAQQAGRPVPSLSQDDLNFIDILKNHQGNIRISEFQYYMLAKIKAYCVAHPEQSFEINSNVVTMVSDTISAVIYEDKSTGHLLGIEFDNLLIAEGAKRNLTNKLFGTDNVKSVTSVDSNPCAHAVGFVEVDLSDQRNSDLFNNFYSTKPVCTPFLPLSINLRRKDIQLFTKYGWDYKSDLPNFYIRIEPDRQRFYFACEIPAQWQKTLDEIASNDPNTLRQAKAEINRLISEWIKIAITNEYPGLDPKILKLITEGQDKVQTFMKDPSRLKFGYKQTRHGSNIFVTADALFSAVYKLGTGHYFAGMAGKAVANCFDANGHFTGEKPFVAVLDTMNRTYNYLLTLFRITKLMKEHSLKSKYIAKPLINRIEGMKWLYRKAMRPQVTNVKDMNEHAHNPKFKPQ